MPLVFLELEYRLKIYKNLHLLSIIKTTKEIFLNMLTNDHFKIFIIILMNMSKKMPGKHFYSCRIERFSSKTKMSIRVSKDFYRPLESVDVESVTSTPATLTPQTLALHTCRWVWVHVYYSVL